MNEPVMNEGAMNEGARSTILDDADFHELARRKNAISLALTLLTMAVYFGFAFLLAFRSEALAARLPNGITLGIPLGIGAIVLCWVFTGIYVRWANTRYDALVAAVKRKVEE